MINLKNKKGIILGIANEKSIAWGIAEKLNECGAQLAFSYVNDSIKKRLKPLAEKCNSNLIYEFSDKNELKGSYVKTSRENFLNTLNVSCYSFTALCQRVSDLMNEGGQILTLSYLGAERVMPHYNVMGIAKSALETSVKYLAEDLGKKNIRVNAISAGPIKTLAASGISDFRYILKWNEYNSPLRRSTNIEEE